MADIADRIQLQIHDTLSGIKDEVDRMRFENDPNDRSMTLHGVVCKLHHAETLARKLSVQIAFMENPDGDHSQE